MASRGEFEGQVAVVTGAARGIGLTLAERFAGAGAAVVVADRDAGGAELAAARIAEVGGSAVAIEVDVAEVASIEALVAATLERFGRLDVLVNNAGHARFGFGLDLSEEDWDYTHSICAKGSFFASQHAGRAMAAAGYGRIVNLSSMTAPLGHARYVAYSSAKGAIEAMTRVLAVELAEYGITVNAVAPGPVETEFAKAALTAERRELRLARIPVGRFGTSDEVADAVLFLARPEAGWVTGTVLAVDGGYRAHGATELRGTPNQQATEKESKA
ncbi:MAG TPA: glucose 1-dehydrogenase [Solirubrobacterales bacterium]|nr:glucose 1-dehydrogenase [Solirubrobacterales bacterium]